LIGETGNKIPKMLKI